MERAGILPKGRVGKRNLAFARTPYYKLSLEDVRQDEKVIY